MAKYRWKAPGLTLRVTLRNPSDKPATARGEYGGEVAPPTWGNEVYASRYDRSPRTNIEENISIREITTVWTIRKNTSIEVDADVEIVVKNGDIYQSIGPPVLRGGPNFGRLSQYLEIETILRK